MQPRSLLDGGLLLLIVGAVAHAQTPYCSQAMQRFGGPGDDILFGLRVDGAGNRYLGGTTQAAGQTDLLLLSYAAGGSLSWALRWGSATVNEDIGGGVLDPTAGGSVYVTGETFGAGGTLDVPLLRLSPAGAVLWSHTWDSGASDHADAACMDAAGNLFLAGGTRGFGATSEDVLLLEFPGARGALTQPPAPVIRTWDGAGNDDSINAACIDASGATPYLYLAGNTQQVPGSYRLLLQKYDTNLGLMWSRSYQQSSHDDAEVVTTDAAGAIYVGGVTRSAGRSDDDALLLKLDALGAPQWKFQYGDMGDENIAAVAFGPQGTVHVTGQSQGATLRGIYLVLDGATGSLLHQTTWQGSGNAGLGELAFVGTSLLMASVSDAPVCNFTPAAMVHATTSFTLSVMTGTLTTRTGGTLRTFGTATPESNGTGGQLDGVLLELQPCAASFTPLGVGCAGSVGVPTLAACPGSTPIIGASFCAQVANVPVGPFVPILLLGARLYPSPIPLTAQGLPGCLLYVNFFTLLAFTNPTQWIVNLPADPCLLRGSFYVQPIIVEPSLSPQFRLANAAVGVLGL